ncbi:MAG: hypothetical protein GX955_05660 [Treponema sp.]|nr:hypothetical protein [Treponema sp.]
MKKKFVLLSLLVLLSLALYAQSASETEENFTYFNVDIIKVYQHKDAYFVLYNKNGNKMGQVALPKEWFQYGSENQSRIRPLPSKLAPYLTVIYKDGAFYKVYLNMPVDRLDPAWAILDNNIDISAKINKETLEMSF